MSVHGRRRSSALAAQVLEAIRETDEEVFEEILQYDLVALGGGVATGYWGKAIAGSLGENGRTAAIVSGDPAGFAPFERPALSKTCLNPGAKGSRDFSCSSSEFPFVCKGSGGEAHAPEWYKDNGITILSSCQAVSVDLDQKFLKVKRVTASNGQLVFGDTIKVVYGRLLIATGARPRKIADEIKSLDNISKGLQGSCSCTRHPDVGGSPLACTFPDRFGFGSVHYLRDFGDTVKLVHAMGRVEADGQDTCKEPVVLIGGGFISCEVAAAVATYCPGMQLVMVMPGEDVMSSSGFGKEVCHFYEKQLARVGVAFAKGYRVNRLWGIEEEGCFPTLERSLQGSCMKKTFPRTFGPADPHFTDCRGVVLSNTQTGEKVWLAARFVVVGIGSVPNSDLFLKSLFLSEDGGIITDSYLRTSHPSGDVFAAGDVACVPVPLGGNGDTSFMATANRSEHVKAARDMGAFAAGMMLGGDDSGESYNPVPHMYSRFLDISWKFYGFARGEVCVLGMETFPTTRTFGAFWLHGGKIVGAFLEEDPSSRVDHSAILERMAREQPAVLSIKRLRKCPLEKLLANPHCLEPPKLGVGEFHADTDETSIEEAFRKRAGGANTAKTADMASIMQELGADWDEDELEDALRALDPSDSGAVNFSDFVEWWSN
ncbi:unnamed protein product [Ectocarpus fasciculatus]